MAPVSSFFFVIFILATVVFSTPTPSRTVNCVLNLNKNFRSSSPLFVNKKSLEIIYPRNASSALVFDQGQTELIHCFGGSIVKFNISGDSKTETAACFGYQNFTHPETKTSYSFIHVNCSKNPEPLVEIDRARSCHNGDVVNIGYELKPGVLLKSLDLCHDASQATTTWAHSKLLSTINNYKGKEFKTPGFSKGPYFKNVRISQVYPQLFQKKTFLRIFDNDTKLVDKYLPEGPDKNYFVKGHLVARADKFYYPEQFSTYYYVNVLPMWSSINNGNWKSVETTMRRVASDLGADLDIWTGGLGILKLHGKEIWLAQDIKNSDKLLLPAPKLLYKLVHDVKNDLCLAFVTINDPYLENDVRVCKPYDECTKKFPQFDKIHEGLTYCCLCQEFLKHEAVKKLQLPVSLKSPSPLPLS